MSQAKSPCSKWSIIALLFAALAAPASPLQGQNVAPANGAVDDWSSHHVVFSNPGIETEAFKSGRYSEWLRIVNDPRYVMQQEKRGSAVLKSTFVAPAQPLPASADISGPFGLGEGRRLQNPTPRIEPGWIAKPALKRDWSMNNGAVPSATMTITVGTVSGGVSATSTITVDGQEFTTSAPATQTGTLTETGSASGTSLVIGASGNTVTYQFSNTTLGTPATGTCLVYNGGATGSRTTMENNLLGAITNGAAGAQSGNTAWKCASGSSPNPTATESGYTNSGTTHTITLAAVNAGATGYGTPTTGSDFSYTAGTTGTNGPGDTATTFNYWNGASYDTADQLANDLYNAFILNTTLYGTTGAFTISNPSGTSNEVTFTSVAPGVAGNSYTASDASFTAVSLSNSGDFSGGANTVVANVFPAKYEFSTTAASCSDYVVYPTFLGGSDATVIAYNNIYSTTCTTGSVPNVAWAYNTGGIAALSPILSYDGTQVAYIQTNSGVASLVILKPSATANNGTVASPASATSYGSGSYRGCAAPCFTTITLHGNPNDSNSSPFYLYGSADTLYVGDNSGKLHKFTGVFLGTPAEVTTGGWPIAVSANVLTSPVYDSTSGNIFVADSGGYLYSYLASNATHEMTSSKLTYASGTTGIVDGPVVDPSTEKVYVVAGDDANTSTDGSFSCTSTTGCSGVFQFSASNTTTGTGACAATSATAWPSGANCGLEAVFGVGSYPNMYDGAFDNTYFNGTGTSGYLWECSPANPAGTDIAPRLAAVALQSGGGIVASGDVIGYSTVTTAISAFTPNTPGVACSPVTEFYNTGNSSTVTTINESGGIGTGTASVTVASSAGIAAGNYIQIGSEDILVTAVAGSNLTIARGQIGTSAASHSNLSDVSIPAVDYLYLSVTENANVTPGALACTGTSGACLYSIAVGTSSGSHVVASMAPTNGLGSAGGTTGIIVDNSLTTAGESQIYYSSLSNATCSGNGQSGTSGTASCAVQTSQTAP